MDIKKIPTGKNVPDEVNVIIEIPQGGLPTKYEFDKDAGAIWVDRIAVTPMRYPANYGFIPHTLGQDGDPVDALVLTPEPLFPGVVIPCRPLGYLAMEDDGGIDEKVILVPTKKLSPLYDDLENVEDLSETLQGQIRNFFEHYKDLEKGKWAKLGDWHNAADAKKLILEGIERAQSEDKAA